MVEKRTYGWIFNSQEEERKSEHFPRPWQVRIIRPNQSPLEVGLLFPKGNQA